ncbi:MAG: TIGR00366 family protein [Planctomycetota bacterium]|nr:TIGR00366 family protein [Planctomycetota bacterium]
MPRVRVPHTLVLLFGMSVIAYGLTFVPFLPPGEYRREVRIVNEQERSVVVAGSYRVLPEDEQKWLGPHVVFTAVPRGFAASQDIIFFVFLIGGCFGVFRATGAADAGIGALLRRLGHRPQWLLAGAMLVFAAGSSAIGMAEEYLPFVPILLALCFALGYDAVTAVGVLCVGYGVGYGAAAVNPFTIVVAQGVAGLDSLSGMWYRLLVFPFFFAIGLHHVLRYARRVKNDPSRSLVADLEIGPPVPAGDTRVFTRVHAAILAVIFLAIAFLVVALTLWHWYLVEMGAYFVFVTILLAVVARIGPSTMAKHFCKGAGELTTTALLIGFARAIKVVLDEGRIVDTIVRRMATPLAELGESGAAVGMLVVQSLCNFFIPSGSGQAVVTMPIMAPLSDVLGIEKQVAVLAYQFGDGFTNILVPTNAVLIGILTMAKVPYERWLRFVLPLMVKLFVVAALAMVVAVWIGYE